MLPIAVLILFEVQRTCTPLTPCAVAPAAAFLMTLLDTCLVDSRGLPALVSDFAGFFAEAALAGGFNAMCSCGCVLLLLLLLMLLICAQQCMHCSCVVSLESSVYN
jgi:hypothetical protein